MLVEIQEPIVSEGLFSDGNLFPEGTSDSLDLISTVNDTSGICYH